MTRKSPVRHKVHTHTREGKRVSSFIRGKGDPKAQIKFKRKVSSFVVGRERDPQLAEIVDETLASLPKSDLKNIRKIILIPIEKKVGRVRVLAEYRAIPHNIEVYLGAEHHDIVHEIGHSIFFGELRKRRKELLKYSQEIWRKKPIPIRHEGFIKKPVEAWAEGYAFYRLAPQDIKRIYPDSYKYFKEFFGE